MTNETPEQTRIEEARRTAEENFKTYGDIVWTQFKKYPLSYYSLYGVVVLFIIATIAPVIALNVPFVLTVSEGAGPEHMVGTTFPWFAALFDRNFFESGLDIFFNWILFSGPVAWIVFAIIKRKKTFKKKQEFREFRYKYVLWATIAIGVSFMMVYLAGFSQPYVDYSALADREGISAIFPPLEYSYRDVDLNAVVADPSWTHWLGTDREGRDVFTRILYGTRISLTIGVVAVAIYMTIGILLGGVAGYFGGWVDVIALRLIEVMICFPVFFLILTLRGFIDDATIFHIMILIGVTRWTGIARLVRGEFLRLKNQEFVQAAIALGLRQRSIIFRHVMPNAMGPVFVAATFGVAGAILIEASLSFLGLGPATAPSWGQILTAGRETGKMSLILPPGFAIFVTISLLNLVGEGMRDALDPKLRK